MILLFVGCSVFALLLLVFQKLYSKFIHQLFILLLLNEKYVTLNLYCLIIHKVFLLLTSHYFMILIDWLIKDYYQIQTKLNYRCQVKANCCILSFNLKIHLQITFFRIDPNEDFVMMVIYLPICLTNNYKYFIFVLFSITLSH